PPSFSTRDDQHPSPPRYSGGRGDGGEGGQRPLRIRCRQREAPSPPSPRLSPPGVPGGEGAVWGLFTDRRSRRRCNTKPPITTAGHAIHGPIVHHAGIGSATSIAKRTTWSSTSTMISQRPGRGTSRIALCKSLFDPCSPATTFFPPF